MAHAENLPTSRARGRRRAAALGSLLLAGSLALTGCSSKDSKPDAKAPASRAGSTGRRRGPPASRYGVGHCWHRHGGSLSDAQLGYIVTAIPAGLDVKRVAILQDFVAYDQMSWKLWVGGGQDTSKVPTVTTGNLQQQLLDDAANLKNKGQKAKTPVKVAISEVAMSANGQSATVTYCVDLTQVTYIDAQGKDVTEPTNKARIPAKNTMVPGSGGHWLASEEEETGEPNTCKVG